MLIVICDHNPITKLMLLSKTSENSLWNCKTQWYCSYKCETVSHLSLQCNKYCSQSTTNPLIKFLTDLRLLHKNVDLQCNKVCCKLTVTAKVAQQQAER
ncbi:Olfactory receptor 4C6 [Frankliniella fusca]|uniref:Olfactory receptor 4C6 n=1 Tax=Frankliniella fusca TaxID=407009 RepID=A0AAE1GVT1_9NEOP|nr:Olfactory receptor 4C6 [Frankliniella fusca]